MSRSIAIAAIEESAFEARPWTVVALALATALLAWPLLAAGWLPFVDYPQHLATIAVFHAPEAQAFAPWFDISYGKTQYLLVYWIGQLFASFLDIESAGRAAAVASIALLPIAVATWLGQCGRPAVLGALAAGCTMHVFVMWGFLNFTLGITTSIFALAAVARVLRRPDVRGTVVLAITSLLAFYSHPLTFAWFGIGAVLHAADHLRCHGLPSLLRPLASCVAAAVPSLVAVAFWLAQTDVLAQGVAIARNGMATAVGGEAPLFMPIGTTLDYWRSQSFATWSDGSGERVGYAFFAAIGSMVVVRLVQWRRERCSARQAAPTARSWAPEAILATTVLLYAFAPFAWRLVTPINWRLLPIGLALLPVLGPRRITAGPVRFLATALGVGLAVAASTTYRAGFARTDAEMGDLASAIACTEPGKRLVGLVFEPRSVHVDLPIYMHVHQYYQAHRGGLACFSFAEFPMSPLVYRPDAAPPPFAQGFEWNAALYDHATHGDHFDYWLVRSLPRCHTLFAKTPPSGARSPVVLHEGGTWTLFGRAPR